MINKCRKSGRKVIRGGVPRLSWRSWEKGRKFCQDVRHPGRHFTTA